MRPGPALLVAAVLVAELTGQEDFPARYDAAVQLLGDQAATVMARRRAFDRALSSFLRTPQTDPRYRQWVEMGAYSATQAGKTRMATELYEQAWQLGRRTAAVLEARLRAMIANGDVTAAVMAAHGVRDTYAQALAALLVDRELYGAFVNGGDVLMRRGQLDAGLWVFQRQAELLPRGAIAQANLGLALRQVGRSTAARAAYEKALRLLAEPVIANDFGLLLKGIGKHQAAAAVLRQSLELQEVPGRAAAATNLGVLFQRTGIRARPDPLADLQARLRQDPQKSLTRRVTLDLLAREQAEGKSAAAGRSRKPAE
ncbi:MAG: hypothetical protein ACYTKC_10100 [Planctomycetota bacterium]